MEIITIISSIFGCVAVVLGVGTSIYNVFKLAYRVESLERRQKYLTEEINKHSVNIGRHDTDIQLMLQRFDTMEAMLKEIKEILNKEKK